MDQFPECSAESAALSMPLVTSESQPVQSGPDSSLPLRTSLDPKSLKPNEAALRKAKIMIVDDEELVIRVVRRFLSSDGYENFVTLTDPREALEAIDREQPRPLG